MPITKALTAMLPEKLYRYRSCSTLNMDAFDKDLVYAVTADKFNAPYDTLIKYNAGNLGQMFKKLFIGISEMIRKISTIACFSETVQSVTMWSHYADNHEGFALEYDLRFIPTEGSAMEYFIFPVVYDDNRFEATDLIAWCFAKCYGVDIKQPDQFANFKVSLHKSTQWEYEKEWRLFHNIQDGSDKSRATSIIIVPKAIYYGKNISPINRKLLHFIAREKRIAEYDMYIDSASFKYEMLSKPAVF